MRIGSPRRVKSSPVRLRTSPNGLSAPTHGERATLQSQTADEAHADCRRTPTHPFARTRVLRLRGELQSPVEGRTRHRLRPRDPTPRLPTLLSSMQPLQPASQKPLLIPPFVYLSIWVFRSLVYQDPMRVRVWVKGPSGDRPNLTRSRLRFRFSLKREREATRRGAKGSKSPLFGVRPNLPRSHQGQDPEGRQLPNLSSGPEAASESDVWVKTRPAFW